MNKRLFKNCMMIFFIFLLVFSVTSSTLYAAVNSDYTPSTTVEENALNEKAKESVVLDAFGSFIYAVASFVESIVGNLFQYISGDSVFPWADRILFNAIPILDVNFFNASNGSLFKTADSGNYTDFANIIRNTYFTILTIATGFLTIIVGVAATRLALSSIASEKAKYKEALTKWLFSIVLLFLIHNLMSFVLWANEKMVEVASSMVNTALNDEKVQKAFESMSWNGNAQDRVDNFITQQEQFTAGDLVPNPLFTLVTGGAGIFLDPVIDALASKFNGTEEAKAYLESGQENVAEVASELMEATNDYVEYRIPMALTKTSFWQNFDGMFETLENDGEQSIKILAADVKHILEDDCSDDKAFLETYAPSKLNDDATIEKYRNEEMNSSSELFSKLTGDNKKIKTLIRKEYQFHKIIVSLHEKYVEGKKINLGRADILAKMAEFFKKSAWTYETDDDTGEVTGWIPSDVSVTGALLYAIFVTQSIMYLFSYTKRFFYIIVLAIMAPAIVVLDFLGKSLS